MNLRELAARLAHEGPWYFVVIKYGASHAVMTLRLHRGDYLRHLDLVLGRTTYFRGPLGGGPFSLSLIGAEKHDDVREARFESADGAVRTCYDSEHGLRVESADGTLEIRFHRVSVVRDRL